MVRSAKLRQKVSGRLRTLAGATQFCAIRAVGAENSVLLCRVPRTVSCPLTRALVTYRAAPWGPITLPYAASPTCGCPILSPRRDLQVRRASHGRA
jgi:hypothetical protein